MLHAIVGGLSCRAIRPAGARTADPKLAIRELIRSMETEIEEYFCGAYCMSHNRKMTAAEAKKVEEFALLIRVAAQAKDLQASLYQRALLKAQMDLTAALIDAVKPKTGHKKRTSKRR
jgi:hypothetical protein